MTDVISEIEVNFPETTPHHLNIAIGACRFQARAYDGDYWIEGEYEHPENALQPKIKQRGGDIFLKQEFKIEGLAGMFNRSPAFDLNLGKGEPYSLGIDGGAFEAKMELGGLPLTNFSLNNGAGKVSINFAEANPQSIETVDIDAGAMALKMTNLANANFKQFNLDGGASKFDLDFSGALQQDGTVNIQAGMASVNIFVPSNVAAKIYAESKLGSVRLGNGFMKKGGAYWTQAAVAGNTPTLTIHVDLSVGTLAIDSD